MPSPTRQPAVQSLLENDLCKERVSCCGQPVARLSHAPGKTLGADPVFMDDLRSVFHRPRGESTLHDPQEAAAFRIFLSHLTQGPPRVSPPPFPGAGCNFLSKPLICIP
jgi:hypothetical protein